MSTRKEILEAARVCVCGDREQDYGSPENNFETIAAYWGRHLWARHPELQTVIAPNELVDAVDVAVMLAHLKLARIGSGHAKQDNWIDLAGYAACGGEIESRKTETRLAQPAAKTIGAQAKMQVKARTKQISPCTVVEYDDLSWDWRKDEDGTFYGDHRKAVLRRHIDCTVELVTLPDGKVSAGWWENSKPPVDLSGIWVKDDEEVEDNA